MKLLLFLILSILISSCEQKSNIQGKYFPEEYRQEFNLSAFSEIQVSSNTVKSGETIDVLLISKDQNSNNILIGGGTVSFSLSGTGSGNFSNFQDQGNGTYSAKFTGSKVGSVNLFARMNPNIKKKTNSQSQTVTVTIGDLNLEKSDMYFSKKQMLVGESADIIFYPRDASGNLLDQNDYEIHGALLEGTSEGSVSSFSYETGGTYTGSFYATAIGTPTKISLSLRRIGQVLSKKTIEVVNEVPNFSASVISGSNSMKVGKTQVLTLSLYNSNPNLPSVSLVGWPVSFEIGVGNSVTYSKSEVTDSGSGTYKVTITPSTAGTLTITAKANGNLINQTFSVTVSP